MKAEYALRTFGATALTAPGDVKVEGLGAKALAMLALLAESAPASLSRDVLVGVLWERVEPSQGRGSLRQEVRRFKRALGDDGFAALFEVSDAQIGLRAGALDYDGAALEAVSSFSDPDGLAAALEIYNGEFLVDNAARAEPFQDWARERRAYYDGLALTALSRLAETDLAAGRLERCLQAAERARRIDPLEEGPQAVLIRCHLAGGRPGAARVAYERFRTKHLHELGVEPSAALAARIETQQAPAADPAPDPAARPSEARRKPTLAVLNVSRPQTDEQAYLAAGVVEELVANLARSSWLRVASLNAPFMPREADVDLAQRDLRGSADYILRLNVQLSRDRASIVATLTRVSDHETLFSDALHAGAGDLLELQRDTAVRISAIFEEKMLDDQGEQLKGTAWGVPTDMDHWRLLMRARWLFWKSGRRSNAEAQRLLAEALRMQPDDAPSLCMLAFSQMLDGWCGWGETPDAAMAQAEQTALRAVRTAPGAAWPHFTLGAATSAAPGGLGAAQAHMRHALRLAPGLVCASGDLARLHAFAGDSQTAIDLADEAMALSPYDQHYGLWLRTKAIAHYLDENLDTALSLIEYGLVVRKGWFQNHYLKAAILAEMGRVDQARGALAEGEEIIGGYSDQALLFGHPFADPQATARFARALNQAGGRFFQ